MTISVVPTTTTKNPTALSAHVSPSKAAGLGAAVGVLSTLAGLFDIPTTTHTVQAATTVTGIAAVVISVVAFILHHLGVSKAQIVTGETFIEKHLPVIRSAADAAEKLPAVNAILGDVSSRLSAVERQVAQAAATAAPGVDVAAIAEEVKARILGAAVAGANPTPPVATKETPLPVSAPAAAA